VRNATGNPNARYGWSCSQSHVCQRITLKLYAGIQLSPGLKHVAFHVLGHLKQRMHTSLGKETEMHDILAGYNMHALNQT